MAWAHSVRPTASASASSKRVAPRWDSRDSRRETAMSTDDTPPQLRASDADRESAAERLRQACLEGRLDSDELEQRLEAAYAGRFVSDLHRLTADVTPP